MRIFYGAALGLGTFSSFFLIFLASEMDGSGKGKVCWRTDVWEDRFPTKGSQSYWGTNLALPYTKQELHLP